MPAPNKKTKPPPRRVRVPRPRPAYDPERPAAPRLATMSERNFQDQVIGMARWGGWLVYHTFDARRSAPGFPDLVLVRHGSKVLFVELKTEAGRLTRAQEEWAQALYDNRGVDYAVWRPRDMEVIRKTLSPSSRPRQPKSVVKSKKHD